jgi:hypothetical protein
MTSSPDLTSSKGFACVHERFPVDLLGRNDRGVPTSSPATESSLAETVNIWRRAYVNRFQTSRRPTVLSLPDRHPPNLAARGSFFALCSSSQTKLRFRTGDTSPALLLITMTFAIAEENQDNSQQFRKFAVEDSGFHRAPMRGTARPPRHLTAGLLRADG